MTKTEFFQQNTTTRNKTELLFRLIAEIAIEIPTLLVDEHQILSAEETAYYTKGLQILNQVRTDVIPQS